MYNSGNLSIGGSNLVLGINDGKNKGKNPYQRALVHHPDNLDKLVINYQGDFEGGTYVEGEKLIVSGNLGIGTQSPGARLTVKGKIHAEEIKIDLQVPADYVFQKYYTGRSDSKSDYIIPTLAEVENFIKENHHLPSIPSAKQIQNEGLELGKMSNLLLQKIEELTLYAIEQNKIIDKQNQELLEIKKELENLKQEIKK